MNEENEQENKSSTLLLLDCFLQLKGLQKILIEKGMVTEKELQEATDEETKLFLKPFLQKVGISDVDNILNTLIENRRL